MIRGCTVCFAPEFIRNSGLNVEHVGDMIEAILGLYFHLVEEGHVRYLNWLYLMSHVSLTQAAGFWRNMEYHHFLISCNERWHSYYALPDHIESQIRVQGRSVVDTDVTPERGPSVFITLESIYMEMMTG